MAEEKQHLEARQKRLIIYFIVLGIASIVFAVANLFPPATINVFVPGQASPSIISTSDPLFKAFMSILVLTFLAIPLLLLIPIIKIQRKIKTMEDASFQ
jgi:hypothetical protein